MSDRSRKILGATMIAATLLLLLAGVFPVRGSVSDTYTARQDPEPLLHPIGQLDPLDPVNRGDAQNLQALPGIGEATAALMIAEREANGPFFYPEDLTSVKGIGNKKLDQIRPFLAVKEPESEE